MKRRVPLLVEGVTTSDGRHIMPGAIHWPDTPLPLTQRTEGWNFDVVGMVTDIRREDDGTITGVIHADDLSGYASADVDDADITQDDETMTVTRARFHAVTMLPEDGWPWPDHPREETP